MILTRRTGDLIDLAEAGEVDVLVHQANLFHVFGAGIAKQIAERLPYAYRADLHTKKGDTKKLGHFSIGVNGENKPVVVNLYSQEGLSPSHTNYDYLYSALFRLRNILEPLDVTTIGFPYFMGCGLADGRWSIVEAIIKDVFEESRFGIVIVKLPEVSNVKTD